MQYRHRRSQHQPADRHDERDRRFSLLQRDRGSDTGRRLPACPTKYLVGSYWNTLPVDSQTYYVAPGGNAALGKLQSTTRARRRTSAPAPARNWRSPQRHHGGGHRCREVVDRGRASTASPMTAAGMMLTETPLSAERSITNVAPEIGLLWKPSTMAVSRPRRHRLRHAAVHQSVRDAGRRAGQQHRAASRRRISATTSASIGLRCRGDAQPTGFYEFFENEFVSQSAGPGLHELHLQRAALGASRDRGSPPTSPSPRGCGFTAAYLYNDQI